MGESLDAAVRAALRPIPDHPRPGILFQDVTPVLADARLFRRVIAGMVEPFQAAEITHVLGIEARGFILGGAMATALGAGFIAARKQGKLPWRRLGETYALEYGTDSIEIHEDALDGEARVLIADDVLATGGTAAAAVRLAARTGAAVAGCSFLLEIGALDGRARLEVPSAAIVSV